ncbi:MAG TPA: glycosyltransferase family 2 protein, partial [Candidatus Dojkabacteria bacterium]|nr:glycosyltransferase family 2 protein [Candidatus Dojkabacteria bacterium]
MKLVIISICFNEENTVGELLDRMPKKIAGIDQITRVIVDDGSHDKTVEIAKKHGAIVLENIHNKKLTFSFQKAVDYALEIGADVMVNIDGDLQFDPEQIPMLVEPVVSGEYDFVVGDRFTDPDTGKVRRPKNMPITKYWGNILGTMVVGWISKKKFNDVTSGFRAYNREALLNININTRDTYTQESFQILTEKKLNIKQIPVNVKYFAKRKSRVVTSVVTYITKSTINILRAFRDFAPLKFFGLLSLFPLIPGTGCSVFVLMYWLKHHTFTPYKFVGFAGIYLVTLAILIFLVGIMADMMDRIVHNQEKILYFSKK